MEKKIYLFDSFGGDLYSCLYEGLDEDGKPRLTNMTPGQPIENFQYLLKINLEEMNSYQLLCEEGKQADSKLVVAMLGQICFYDYCPYERMTRRLEEMRKYGISYDRELQTVKVRIHTLDVEESKSTKYRMTMYVGGHYVGDGDILYDSIKDICSKLRGFFYFIENQTHIPLKKLLDTDESIQKQVKRISPDLFDK